MSRGTPACPYKSTLGESVCSGHGSSTSHLDQREGKRKSETERDPSVSLSRCVSFRIDTEETVTRFCLTWPLVTDMKPRKPWGAKRYPTPRHLCQLAATSRWMRYFRFCKFDAGVAQIDGCPPTTKKQT